MLSANVLSLYPITRILSINMYHRCHPQGCIDTSLFLSAMFSVVQLILLDVLVSCEPMSVCTEEAHSQQICVNSQGT